MRRDEPLRGRGHRFLTIWASGVKRELKRGLTIAVLIIAIAFGIIGSILSIFLAPLIAPGLEITAGYFYQTVANPIVLLLTLLVAGAVGAGLIADDIRHMSLTLYLSRPITALEYLGAKAAIVAIALVLAVIFPAVLGPLVAGVLVYVTWDVALHGILAGIGFGALATTLFAFLALLFSSLTVRKGIAAAGLFASAIVTEGISNPLRQVVGTDDIFYISLYQNLLAVGRVLYGVDAESFFGGAAPDLFWPLSLAILLLIITASLLVAFFRVRSMEVVAP